MVDACQHNNFYTGMNYKLLDPYTKKYAALESAAATHLQCFAGRFAPVTSTICKQMALRTPSILLRRSSLLDLCTNTNHRKRSDPYTRPNGARVCYEYSPTDLCLPDTSHRLPHFHKICRSSDLPSLGQ